MLSKGGEKMDVKLDFSKVNSAIEREAKKAAMGKKYQVSCKHCRAKVVVPVGKSICPACGKEITLTLDFNFHR